MDISSVSMHSLLDQMDHLSLYAQNQQTRLPEVQQAHALFLQNCKAYCDNHPNPTDPNQIVLFCNKINLISKSFTIPEDILKKIAEVVDKTGFSKASTVMSKLSNIFTTTASTLKSCWHLSETLQWLFIDGKHAWKQQKYQLVLQNIVDAFHHDNVDLNLTYKTLQGTDQETLSEWQKMTLSWLKPLLEPSENFKESYRLFIVHLRTACRYLLDKEQKDLLEKFEDPLVQLTGKICYYRFSEVHLYGFCEKLVEMMIQDGMKSLNPLHKESLEDVFKIPLNQQFEAIHAASSQLKEPQIWTLAQKASATTNLYYDPQLKSNIPYVLCDLALSPQHSLRILRMGTPTNSTEGITPEFRLFLHYCKSKNEKVFYTSEQAENSWIESGRNQQIRLLAQEFQDTFFMIVLPNDTPFYHQKAPHNSPYQTFQDFKEDFKSQLHSVAGGFYFDKTWMEHPSFPQRIETCLNEIHEDVFAQSNLLSLQERLDFIEIVYARIVLEMISFLKLDHQILIKFLFIICRDDNDRGVKSKVTLVSLCLLYLGKFSNAESQKMLSVFTHAPKIMVMKAEMNERRERLMSVLDTLSKPEAMLRLRIRQNTHPIVSDLNLNS